MYSINLFLIILIILVSKSRSIPIGDQNETSYDSNKCQLARALQKQEVDKTELKSLLCVARYRSNFNPEDATLFGMFRVDERWWCGKDHNGGNCNVKCQDLLTDINLDAKCGRLILKMSGLRAWGMYYQCKRPDEDIDNCFN